MSKRLYWTLGSLVALAATGCAPTKQVETVAEIYDLKGELDVTRHDPILAIPGFLGTTLEAGDSGEIIWGRFLAPSANPKDPRIAALLALPIDDAPLHELRDDTRPAGVLRVAEVALGKRTLKLNAYPGIISGILAGWSDEHGGQDAKELARKARETADADIPLLDEVAYDWRRDVAEAAARLDAHLDHSIGLAKRHRRDAGLPVEDVRLDVVGHSTGTLVLSYYLRYGGAPLPEDGSVPAPTWAGAEKIRRAVFVAPPNLGSSKAFLTVAFGARPVPILPEYPAVIGGTFASLFQLMPPPSEGAVVYEDGEVVDLYDPAVWEKMGWGIFEPGADEMRAALMPGATDPTQRLERMRAYQARLLTRARQFHEAVGQRAETPPHTELHLFASDSVPTAYRVVVSREDGRLVRVETAPGDGTVARHSALADVERTDGELLPLQGAIDWTSVHWVPGDHMGLIGSAGFVDNLLYLLFQHPAPTRAEAPATATDPGKAETSADAPETDAEAAPAPPH